MIGMTQSNSPSLPSLKQEMSSVDSNKSPIYSKKKERGEMTTNVSQLDISHTSNHRRNMGSVKRFQVNHFDKNSSLPKLNTDYTEMSERFDHRAASNMNSCKKQLGLVNYQFQNTKVFDRQS